MRIVSGDKRGMILSLIPDRDIRPTPEKVREAVYGKLQFFIQGKVVLDLFAGCGAMGVEAVSRGADYVVFVDAAPKSVRIIHENITKAGYEKKCTVLLKNYKDALMSFSEQSFDVVYIDPPYAEKDYYYHSLELISANRLVRDGGYVFLESDQPLHIDGELYNNVKVKKYGKTYLTILEF